MTTTSYFTIFCIIKLYSCLLFPIKAFFNCNKLFNQNEIGCLSFMLLKIMHNHFSTEDIKIKY